MAVNIGDPKKNTVLSGLATDKAAAHPTSVSAPSRLDNENLLCLRYHLQTKSS